MLLFGHIVRTVSSKFPSIVTFYSDCATYTFWHPYEAKEISMVMHYGDMSQATLAARQRRFTFRINRDLGAASGIDCDAKYETSTSHSRANLLS